MVKNYKYLRVWVNQKLTLDDQIKHIAKKSKFIKVSLAPLLSVASLEYRKNLWILFVRPLLDFTLPIHAVEDAESRKEELRRLVRKTFKDFTKLSSTTPNNIIIELCGYDVDSRSKLMMEEQLSKWKQRMRKCLYHQRGQQTEREGVFVWQLDERNSEMSAWVVREPDTGFQTGAANQGRGTSNSMIQAGDPQNASAMQKEEVPINLCRNIPAVGVEYINLLTKLCPRCSGNVIMNLGHLRVAHNIELPDPRDLFKLVHEAQDKTAGTRTYKMLLGDNFIREKVLVLNKFISSQD